MTCAPTSRRSSSNTTIVSGCIRPWATGHLEEFEQAASSATTSQGATMSFFRHPEIFRSDVCLLFEGKPTETGSPDHRLDESPAGYSLAGWSPSVVYQTIRLDKEARNSE